MLLTPQHAGQQVLSAAAACSPVFLGGQVAGRRPATRTTDADLNIEIKMEFVGMRTQRDGIDLLFSLIV